MRVVYLGHTAVLSGGELAFASLLPALVDQGVDPLVLLAEDGPLVGRLRSVGIPVEVVPMSESTRSMRRQQLARIPGRVAVDTAAYAARLARRIRAAEADVVHTFSLKAALYGGTAGRLAGRPVVWSIQDRIAPDYLPGAAVSAVRAAAKLLPQVIIANSRTTASTMLGHGPAPVVIAPACALSAPSAPPPVDPFTVGLVGRLSPWKGQDVFLQAFAAAFGTRSDGGDGDVAPQARAVLIGSALFGEDDYEATLRRWVDDAGLAGRVDFRGFCEDVPSEIAALHAVVHASTVAEPFGMVVVEAMSAGRAVIATDIGGPSEVITDGVDGLLVPSGDVEALAAAMRRLATDHALREALGAAGPSTAARYGPGPAAAATAQVYDDLISRRHRRDRTAH